MTKEDFLAVIYIQMKKHPEWLNDTMQAVNMAIIERLKEDREIAISIQFSLSMLYSNQFGKHNLLNQIKVLEGLMECDTFTGNPFSAKIKKKLKEKLKKKEEKNEKV